jgi:hypothetical protein
MRNDTAVFTAELDRADDLLAAADAPRWTAWRHALAARRALVEDAAEAAVAAVASAQEALDKCPPTAMTALTLAFLAHVEVVADHADAAMRLAVDASLLAEGAAAAPPSRE